MNSRDAVHQAVEVLQKGSVDPAAHIANSVRSLAWCAIAWTISKVGPPADPAVTP